MYYLWLKSHDLKKMCHSSKNIRNFTIGIEQNISSDQYELTVLQSLYYSLFVLGYDLSQVNMYINKLFENVGSLMYEETEDNERYNFTITGVQSALGEKLEFQQVNRDIL